ncbi:hypothetical protein AB4212_65595, partial [Streptomyces sp. 2MCAF27]
MGMTGGVLTANKATFEKGSPGAPAHFHTKATEMFLALDDTMWILVGGESRWAVWSGRRVRVSSRAFGAMRPAAGHHRAGGWRSGGW